MQHGGMSPSKTALEHVYFCVLKLGGELRCFTSPYKNLKHFYIQCIKKTPKKVNTSFCHMTPIFIGLKSLPLSKFICCIYLISYNGFLKRCKNFFIKTKLGKISLKPVNSLTIFYSNNKNITI